MLAARAGMAAGLDARALLLFRAKRECCVLSHAILEEGALVHATR